MLVTSLCLIADLIDTNLESSAFVYGWCSFSEKLANGVAIMVVQNNIPISETDIGVFFQLAVPVLCGGSALLGILSVAMLWLSELVCSRQVSQVTKF